MSGALDSALRGLAAARAGMELVADNLANANTEGFARRRLLLESAPAVRVPGIGDIGGGVNIDGVERLSDPFLEQRVNALAAETLRGDALVAGLEELEGLLPELEGSGITQALTDLETAAHALTVAPNEPGARNSFLGSVEAFADLLHQITGSISRYESDLNLEISGVVDQVNALASEVGQLNVEILNVSAMGGSGNNLRDQRAVALQRLQELVGGEVRFDGAGSVNLFVEGRPLVTSQGYTELGVTQSSEGMTVRFGSSLDELPVGNGKLAGLLQLRNVETQTLRQGLDGVASATALAYDTAHARSVGTSGPFDELLASQRFLDEGDPLGLSLADVDARFPIQAGELTVAVEDVASGEVTTARVAIDPAMTVSQLLADLSAVDGIEAKLVDNSLGLIAEPGKRFSFTPLTATRPDPLGAFGGTQATVSGAAQEPFTLSVPTSLSVTVDGGAPQVLPLTAGDFANPLNATADEVAAALNASLTGAQASVVRGRVVVQSASSGPTSTVAVGSSATATALGLDSASDSGADVGVEPLIGGRYTGTSNETWEVAVVGSGTVGVTPGLRLEVRSSTVLATVDIGPGYAPGSPIELAAGVEVHLGPGDLSDGESFFLDVTADPDTAGLLTGLGLNTLFSGSTASDLDLRSDLKNDRSLLATARAHNPGDTGGAMALALAAGTLGADGLTPRETAESVFETLAHDLAGVRRSVETSNELLRAVEARRAALSGVSIDEEAANLIQLERAYSASAQVISAVRELDQVLFSLVR